MRHLQCCTVDDHKTTESGSRIECGTCNVVQWMIIKQQSQGAEVNATLAMLYSG